MKKKEALAVLLMFLATVGTVLGILGIERFRIDRYYTLELIARTPDNGNWYPSKITVPFGKEVRILIRNIDTVSHGFALPEFNTAVREIKAGETAAVEFMPDKRGTFPFMCTVWCSDRHLEMTGELIVQ